MISPGTMQLEQELTNNSFRAAGGFTSGFIPTNSTPSGVTFQIVVNDTKPVWFYCAQTKKAHCQAGMVGSINA